MNSTLPWPKEMPAQEHDDPFISWNWQQFHTGEVFDNISEKYFISLEFTLKDYVFQCFQVKLLFEMLISWN